MAGPGPGSGLTLATLRSIVQDQATFADTTAEIDRAINEKHKQMVVRSEWLRKIAELGTTVAGQAEYDLPADVAQIVTLTVDDEIYDAESIDSIFLLRKGRARLGIGQIGVFSDYYGSDGTQQLALYPEPDTTGLSIEAVAAHTPADLSADDDYPIVPEFAHEAIADGAIAWLLRLHQESTLQEIEQFEARYLSATEEVRRFRNSRHRPRVTQIGVKGRHW